MQDVLQGIEYRMGYDTEPDHALPNEALVVVLDGIKKDAKECSDKHEANELWKTTGAFTCLATSTSLRGYKGFTHYTDLAGLKSHLDKVREDVVPPELTHNSVLNETTVCSLPQVAICLLGIFKGEGVMNYHNINVADEDMSRLQTRWWVKKWCP